MPLHDAEHEPHPHGAPPGTHVLVIANETLADDELNHRITHGDNHPLRSRHPCANTDVAHALHESDVDSEVANARTRLQRSLAWAREHGIAARGEVGDPGPTIALEDELRDSARTR